MPLTSHVGFPILLPQMYKILSVVLFFKTVANLHNPLSPMLLLQIFNLAKIMFNNVHNCEWVYLFSEKLESAKTWLISAMPASSILLKLMLISLKWLLTFNNSAMWPAPSLDNLLLITV